jgi:hypothetical protein
MATFQLQYVNRRTADNRPLYVANGLVQRMDYAGKLSQRELAKISENYPVYKLAADAAGIPWQMLAAIHYRESSLSTARREHGGPFQFDPPLNQGEEEFDVGAFFAAKRLQQISRFRLYPSSTDETVIKDSFYGWNGRAYGSFDRSPYVMNFFDDQHRNMRIHGTILNNLGERIRVDRSDSNLGAYTVFIELKNASL